MGEAVEKGPSRLASSTVKLVKDGHSWGLILTRLLSQM